MRPDSQLAGLVNATLDWFLVLPGHGLGLGLAGAAVATLAAQSFAAVAFLMRLKVTRTRPLTSAGPRAGAARSTERAPLRARPPSPTSPNPKAATVCARGALPAHAARRARLFFCFARS